MGPIRWYIRNGVWVRVHGCYLRDRSLAMVMIVPMLVRMMCVRLDMSMTVTVMMVRGAVRTRFVQLLSAGVFMAFR